MPKSRGSEMSQRQSPRVPLHLKTTVSSEANSLHRPISDRSSPRSAPLQEKKRNTRVAELESKLGLMQEELKKVKDQLASAEAARLELEEAKKPSTSVVVVEEEIVLPKNEHESEEKSQLFIDNTPPEPVPASVEPPETVPAFVEPPATDVFEVVPTQKTQEANEDKAAQCSEIEGKGENKNENENEKEEDPVITELRAKLSAKEKELETFSEANESLKKEATAAAEAKEEELGLKLKSLEEEMNQGKLKSERLAEKLATAEGAAEALEAEMRRMRVQTEQWRKAAEAAAAVFSGGGGYVGGWSPVIAGDDVDEEGNGGGKRKGAGIRVLGDLWRKRGGGQQGKH